MPSDAFGYIPVGLLPSPGTCCKCGSNQRDCIDIGITVEYFGAILVCIECINDLVNVEQLQFMHRKEALNLMTENEKLKLREGEMSNMRRDVRNALVAVADNIDYRVDHPTVGLVVAPAQPLPEQLDFRKAFGETD